ncbi:hypothetical protein [Halodesulfovibrio sp. MK-HDV]|uniref:hypothetical protein n=1 Tax=Halodesulfovibrio sp. MK-HDV TaxID=2599925 RepID=UPI0013FAC2EF|nr:hypothetical protein [Halodesulfovibrio sp. MK-HDV]KAF1074998.1 hypothetical protein MKHDV_02306 [Halodesulfovibrio sp. MK-HDV]
MKNVFESSNVYGMAKTFVLLSLYALLIAIGMHKGVKIFLYIAGISGALLLTYEWFKMDRPSIPTFFIAPLLFLIYVLISPGTFFH